MKAHNKKRKIEHDKRMKTLERVQPKTAEPRFVSLFDDLYGKQTANARNMVAGLWSFTKLME